jgi:Spy/CpxP family protein refolding chaperone
MKKILPLSFLLLPLVTGSFAATASAAAAPSSEPSAQPAAAPHRHRAARHPVARRLGLSTEQAERLRSVRAKAAAEVKAIRNDSALSAEQKRAKVRETLAAARSSAREVLTPEQRQRLHHLRARVLRRHGLQ